MRLDFNVLWVDDQPDRVQAQIEAIARQMSEEGFNFNPTLCRSINDVQVRISDNVFTDEVDLILVDWDLEGGVKGQDAIVAIRETITYKDVVFYSAQTTPQELRERVHERGLEGIYCSSRGELVAEVIGVFESLVKKVLDLDHTRGIVMGATSDIDHMTNECLIAVFERLDDDGKKEMVKEALERISEGVERLVQQAKELEEATGIGDLIRAHQIFTAIDRLRILSRLLKLEALAAHQDARTAVVTYIEKVPRGRNTLGHMVLVPEGKPQAIMTADDTVITLEETRELRRIILNLRKEFSGLLLALRAGAMSS